MNLHLRLTPALAMLLACALTVSAQDKKETGKQPVAASNYFPLTVGNQWTYTIEAGGKNATAIAKVEKIEVVKGVSLAKIATTIEGKVVTTEQISQTADGIFRHSINGQAVEPPLCLLKYPAKSGHKWKGDILVGNDMGSCKCMTEAVEVQGPTGKHKAIKTTIHVETNGQEVASIYYFVQNIGFVKQTVNLAGLDIEIVLDKYELAKAPKKVETPAGDKGIEPFNSKDLAGWKLRGDAKKSKWEVGTATVNDKGALVFKKGAGELVNTASSGIDIYTEQEFGDCRVEIEVMVPKGSNSGIYLMGRYEVQVFDSFGKEKLTGGDMGAIYSIAVPKINACKKAGEWQKYVIDFQAPRFDGKKKVVNANFKKVLLNDQVIHENAEVLKGATGGSLQGNEVSVGPLLLQGDHGTVAFRNLRITPMK